MSTVLNLALIIGEKFLKLQYFKLESNRNNQFHNFKLRPLSHPSTGSEGIIHYCIFQKNAQYFNISTHFI